MLEILLICVAINKSEPIIESIVKNTVEAISNRDKVCERENATCGYLANDSGEVVNCGDCEATFEYCGGAAPNTDGSPGLGTPLTCGGGCTEVTSFYCGGRVAVQCSLPGRAPKNNCQMYGNEWEAKWCCNI